MTKKSKTMETVIAKDNRNVTVRLSNRRWNLMLELENAYRTAKSVVKAKHECETIPSMSVEEAMKFIDQL